MPNQYAAVNRLLTPLVLQRLQIVIIDGRSQKVPVDVRTLGSIQPLTDKALNVKPEGERAWAWYYIHTLTNFRLDVNERIWIRGERYKVMSFKDYSRSGYYEYHIIEDFEDDSRADDDD
jgi:hypothetical protein